MRSPRLLALATGLALTAGLSACTADAPNPTAGAVETTLESTNGAPVTSDSVESPSTAPASTTAGTTADVVVETWPLVGGGTTEIRSDLDQPLVLWFWAPG